MLSSFIANSFRRMAEDKKALQAEVVAVKTRWGAEVKLSKAKPDSPSYPLPIAVARTIARPDAAAVYDVDELTVRLWVDSLEAAASPPVRVEVAGPVPEALQRLMAAHVDARWHAELAARGGAQAGWLLEKVLGWCEGAYVELLRLDPSLVEQYEGCDDEGRTIRRFAIAEPPPPPPEPAEGEGGSDSGSSDEGEAAAAAMSAVKLDPEAERQERIRVKAQEEAERQYQEMRRKEREENAQDEPVRIGKKEQERLLQEKRDRKGARTAKTGSKANKANAKERDDAKERTNKKNGLLH